MIDFFQEFVSLAKGLTKAYNKARTMVENHIVVIFTALELELHWLKYVAQVGRNNAWFSRLKNDYLCKITELPNNGLQGRKLKNTN